MSDLSPFAQRRDAPLTAGARLMRGFRRIGIALGALTLLIGLVTSAVVAFNQNRDLHRRYEQAACVVDLQRRGAPLSMNQYRQAEVDMGASGCYGPGYTLTISEIRRVAQTKPAPLEGTLEAIYIGIPTTVAFATIIFGFFWLIGWIFAGFTRD